MRRFALLLLLLLSVSGGAPAKAPAAEDDGRSDVGRFLEEFGMDEHGGETIAYALKMQSGIRTLHDLRAVSEQQLETAGLDTMEQRNLLAKVERELGRLDWRTYYAEKKAEREAKKARKAAKKAKKAAAKGGEEKEVKSGEPAAEPAPPRDEL